MSQTLRCARIALACVVIAVIVSALIGSTGVGASTPRLETRVLGQSKYLAGSTGSLRVITMNHTNGRLIENAAVTGSLRRTEEGTKEVQTIELFAGRTNADGTLETSFYVPQTAEGSYDLVITAQAIGEKDTITQKVSVARDQQILLTTDKPLYQPGQTMHIRALALRLPSLKAAGNMPLTLEVEDGKGNKVFKKKQDTSEFGIASVDFTLATEVNMGRYRIRAILDKTQVEKVVTVERYVLPKFKIKFTPDKTFYLPNETVTGKIQADYFFGKPVADGKVTIKAATFDFQFKDFAEITGRTDETGAFKFEQKLPDYFVGQPLEQGNAFVKFEVTIEDGAEHKEKITQTVPVGAQPLKIIAVPDGGRIIPKVENTIYVMATYPDGSAAQADVTVYRALFSQQKESDVKSWARFKTDSTGIGSFKVTPDEGALQLTITAEDKQKRTAQSEFTLRGSPVEDQILLSTDKALAKVGESVDLTILSPTAAGTVYVDVIRQGQTLLTDSLDMRGGRGDLSLPLTADMSGSLEVHAYRISRSGYIVRDSRMLYVNPADDLRVKINPDKDSYLPGKPAKIAFDVQDRRGRGVAAALGVAIVDESVFALQEMQPGMEKIYFLLEKELMEPKFEVHGLTPTRILEPVSDDTFGPEKQNAARVLFALAQQADMQSGGQRTYTLLANSYEDKLAKMREEFGKRMKADFVVIAKAVTGYYKEHPGTNLKDLGGIHQLVKVGPLKSADLKDQWRHEYDFAPCGCGSFEHSLTISSLGPDGRKGTDDDLGVGGSPAQPDQAQIIDLRPNVMLAKGGMWFDDFGREKEMAGVMDGAFFAEDAVHGMARAPMAAGVEMNAPDELAVPTSGRTVGGSAGYGPGGPPAKEQIRVRQFFPETMYFNPAVITDGSGKATINVDVADSITTWRITSMASSQAGQLGSATEGLKVFQDFFIDIDLPVSLTQNDEVSIPVAVYNYLPTAQTVNLELTVEPWFELLDSATKKLDIADNDVEAVYFRLKVKDIGNHKLTVHAMGSKMSDAISREIEVIPDGKEYLTAINDRLEKTVEKTLVIPESAIDGASNILVKVYPGIFSQVVEGMDKILQMPFGCFEQTSSATYPNILALDYMKNTHKITPEIQMKAEQYINLGYQRLVTFEVPGGGFSWFGDPPANKVLTAYGVMEFADMSKVYEVDPALIQRTQQWLIAQREKDGSWSPDKNYLHEESWGKIQNSNLLPTAWITWSLIHSGYQPAELAPSISYIKEHAAEAKDAYSAAMVANALVSASKNDSSTVAALERLVDMKSEENGKVYWKAGVSTITFTRGNCADVETTALAALALIRSGRFPDVVSKALTYIIQAKDPNGTWGSTQGTILALKALLASLESQTQDINASISVVVNGKDAGSFKITPEDSDVMRQIDCKKLVKEGQNTIKIAFEGKGSSLFQISGKYYIPWDKLAERPEDKLIAIDVSFDRTSLAKDDILTSTVKVAYNKGGTADMVMVDLGTPPGFQVMAEDFEALLNNKVIQRYTVTARQVILYFDKLETGKPVEFTYRMRAKFPIRARTPKSTAYLYYNPEINDVAPPVSMVVQ